MCGLKVPSTLNRGATCRAGRIDNPLNCEVQGSRNLRRIGALDISDRNMG